MNLAPQIPSEARSCATSVSVVIVNYNAGAMLTECVLSVLRSSVPVRVYVSDNGSTDRSVSELSTTVGPDPRLTIVEHGENLGFARGNNAVLSLCSGDYILFLNPDCVIEPDTIERMRQAMEAHPSAGMGGCLIRNPDGSEQAGCRRFIPTPWRALMRVLRLSQMLSNHPRFDSFILTGQPLPEHPIPVEAISGAFMFVRRAALDRVGALDEGYFLHCEDLDWCMQFRQSGYQTLFVPDVEIVHIKGIATAGRPIRIEWHKHNGMIRFYRKFFRYRYPAPLFYAVVLAVWVRFAMIAAALMVKKVAGTRSAKMPPVLVWAHRSREDGEGFAAKSAVIVTGATSQIGYFLIPRLHQSGYMVHAITRRRVSTHCMTDKAVVWHEVDIVRDKDPLQGIQGARILLHLAPLTTLPPLIEAAAQAGVRRIVAFGSTSRYSKFLSADSREQQWARQLIEAEEQLTQQCARHGIHWTLFRPTLIYGCGMDKNVTTIANFIRRFHFFPIVGRGRGLRSPVHADDLGAACLAVLDRPTTHDRAYNLSGGETLTYREMVTEIFRGLGKRPRMVRVPLPLFSLLLKVARRFKSYRHLNIEMATRIDRDMAFDHRAAAEDFGYAPRNFQFWPWSPPPPRNTLSGDRSTAHGARYESAVMRR